MARVFVLSGLKNKEKKMAEYSYEDIIIDPEDPRLEGAIGKECYLSGCLKIALDYTRHNALPDRLKNIDKKSAAPFVGYDDVNWVVVIIKKEEEPEYVPFEDGDEFLEYYISKANNPSKHKLESVGGIWLKGFDTDVYFMVTELWDDGVVINDSKMRTTQESSDRYCTINDTTSWEELFKDYTFLDGTPCGKLMEDKND